MNYYSAACEWLGWSRGGSSQVIAPNTCHLPAGFYIAYLKLVAWTKLNERPHVRTNHTGPCQKTKMFPNFLILVWVNFVKGRLSYHLCVECFSQLSFDSEMYTKSETAADFVYISESNESWEKHSTQRW